MRPMQRIRMGLLLANIKLGKITKDAYSGPKDPNPENWRTISGAHVHLENGRIDGGAGGKFSGNNWVGKEMHASDPRAQEGDLFGRYGWSVGESKTERETKEKKENLKKQLEEYHSLMINKQRENAENQAYYVYEAARELDPSSKEYKDAIKAIGWNEKDIEEVEAAIQRENKAEAERQEKNQAAWEKTQKENGKTALEKLEEKFSAKKKESEVGTENTANENREKKEELRSSINALQSDYDKKLQEWKTNWSPEIDNEVKTLGQKLIAAKVDAAKQGVILASGLSSKLDEADIDKITSKVETASENLRIVWNTFDDKIIASDIREPLKTPPHFHADMA